MQVYVQDDDGLKKKCGQIEVKDSSSKSAQTYSVDCDETFGKLITGLQIIRSGNCYLNSMKRGPT
jgi:hypothetical protein